MSIRDFMNFKNILFLMALAGTFPTSAQPMITSLSQAEVLVCSNLVAAATATVQWTTNSLGSNTEPWSSFSTNTAGTDGVLQASVVIFPSGPPTFYRVMQTAPAGMALIPAGSFTMGDTIDGNPYGDAATTNVYVAAFYIDTTLVPYGLWESVYTNAAKHGFSFATNSAPGPGANDPVNSENWYDCVKWCNARSFYMGLHPAYFTDAALTQVYTNGETDSVYVNWSANGFRLPTEAEWEKAARGGNHGLRFPWGDLISETNANYYSDGTLSYDLGPAGYNANVDKGSQPWTSAVTFFPPNDFGLYDLAGNLWQYCWDWYGTPYGQPTTNNPTGPSASTGLRVIRGGLWDHDANFSRCANRFFHIPGDIRNEVGFRCVRGH